jgi:hypothetical protein
MTDKQKIETLKHSFEEVIWMAIRYADGRSTYAPTMVRDAIRDFQKVFPDWKPTKDDVIRKPNKDEIGGIAFKSDYLWDLLDDTQENQ